MSDMHASIGLIQAEFRRGTAPWQRGPAQRQLPFVTIARQIGAGGEQLAHALADRLNLHGGEAPPWRAYDRELVEQIARDHHLSRSLVELLENVPRGWFQEVLESFDFGRPSEHTLTRGVVETIRALAEAGHAVIVGRGGVFITRQMARGVHVRLIAPLDYRAGRYAQQFGVGPAEAARRVREIDLNRERFYGRHFARLPLDATLFDLTINTARVTHETALDTVYNLVLQLARREPGAVSPTAPIPRQR